MLSNIHLENGREESLEVKKVKTAPQLASSAKWLLESSVIMCVMVLNWILYCHRKNVSIFCHWTILFESFCSLTQERSRDIKISEHYNCEYRYEFFDGLMSVVAAVTFMKLLWRVLTSDKLPLDSFLFFKRLNTDIHFLLIYGSEIFLHWLFWLKRTRQNLVK